jgi:transcription elongation factor Elf1
VATKPKPTGFDLHCPRCGSKDSFTIDLNDLAGKVSCGNCDDEFTVAQAAQEAEANARRWAAVVRWIEAAGTFAVATPTPAE